MSTVKPTYEYYTLVTSSTNVTNAFDDYIIQASTTAITVTLPSASGTGLKGKIFRFRRVDSTPNLVSIVANGTDTIEGQSQILLDPYRVIKVIRNNTSNGWTRIMENERLYSVHTYNITSLTSTNTIVDGFDVHNIDNGAGGAITVYLPLSTSVPVGTRYHVYATGVTATDSVTIKPTGTTDTLNGANTNTSVITTANAGITFVNASSGAWIQF
jgi:hypothetical protein